MCEVLCRKTKIANFHELRSAIFTNVKCCEKQIRFVKELQVIGPSSVLVYGNFMNTDNTKANPVFKFAEMNDMCTIANINFIDWIRGKICYFSPKDVVTVQTAIKYLLLDVLKMAEIHKFEPIYGLQIAFVILITEILHYSTIPPLLEHFELNKIKTLLNSRFFQIYQNDIINKVMNLNTIKQVYIQHNEQQWIDEMIGSMIRSFVNLYSLL